MIGKFSTTLPPLKAGMIRVNKIRLVASFAVASYIALYCLAYIDLISPRYAYNSFTLNPKYDVLLFGIVFSFVPTLYLQLQVHRPSSVVIWILYLIVYIPSELTIGLLGNVDSYSGLQLISVLFVSFLCLSLTPILYLPKIPKFGSNWKLFMLGVCTIAVLNFLIIVANFGLQFNLVGLDEVYGVRAEYSEQLSGGWGRFAAYSIGWQANVLNPFFVAYGIIYKKPVFVGIGVFGQLFIYSITGFKSVFFSTLLSFTLFIASIQQRKFFGLIMVSGTVFLVLMAGILDVFFEINTLTSLILQRLLIMPGLLTAHYYEFFNTNGTVNLSHSLLSGIFTYPYSLPPANQIGLEYFGSSLTEANANLWADGFANFGLIGIVFFTFLTIFVLWVADTITQKVHRLLGFLVIGVSAFSLVNSSLLTTLLTHGLGFCLLMVLFLPKNEQIKVTKS
jgi:hypothetical protein